MKFDRFSILSSLMVLSFAVNAGQYIAPTDPTQVKPLTVGSRPSVLARRLATPSASNPSRSQDQCSSSSIAAVGARTATRT
jgi:hypothetical protein